MKDAERSRLHVVLKSIYATWHNCGLRKAERGMPKGRLCDDCLEQIRAHVELIEAKGGRDGSR